MRLIVQGGDYVDLDADVMTFDDGSIVLWRSGAEIGRQRNPLERLGLQTAEAGNESDAG